MSFAKPAGTHNMDPWDRVAGVLSRRGGWVSRSVLLRTLGRSFTAERLVEVLNENQHALERREIQTVSRPREEFRLR